MALPIVLVEARALPRNQGATVLVIYHGPQGEKVYRLRISATGLALRLLHGADKHELEALAQRAGVTLETRHPRQGAA